MSSVRIQTKCLKTGWLSRAQQPGQPTCSPGETPQGCQNARRIQHTFAAAATDEEIRFRPVQPLIPVAVVDINSDATVSIEDLEVDEQSLFMKVKEGAANSVVAGLGDIDGLTAELLRSGVNPFPTSPAIDQEHDLVITMQTQGAAGDIADFWLFLQNPTPEQLAQMYG